MKLEKEFLINNVEGDFYCNTVEIQGQIDLTNDERREFFKAHFNHIKAKLIIEFTKPILDDIEIEYLSDVIGPFRNRVRYISKCHDSSNIYKEYIFIYLKGHEYFSLPYFKPNTMYKGMKLNKKYTLEELGL